MCQCSSIIGGGLYRGLILPESRKNISNPFGGVHTGNKNVGVPQAKVGVPMHQWMRCGHCHLS